MSKTYALLLDLYPLLESFPQEASLLVLRIENTAFSLLMTKRAHHVKELLLLLHLAKDLGYMDLRVHTFLEKKVTQLIS